MDVSTKLLEYLNQYTKQPISHGQLNESLSLDDLGLDSLDFLELVYALEEEFGVQLDAEQLGQIATLDKLLLAFSVRATSIATPG